MKNIRILILITLFSLIVTNANSTELKGNTATVNLTPPLDLKFALGGYGARMSQPAEGIHDHVWAKALVHSDGQKKYALVTMDILALPPNVKPQVLKQLAKDGWTVENVMLLSSHSHTSLDMSALNDKNVLNIPQIGIYQPQLLEFVVKSLVKVIKQANDVQKPIVVGTARATIAGMNRNRRGEAASDKDLTITRIDLKDGKPLAVLVNWTAHPTLMDEKDMWLSGGWPGYLQRELEAWIGNGIISMYYNGAQGDQSPIRPLGGSHYEQAEIYGRKIAIKALEVYRSIKPEPAAVFDYNYHIVTLPARVAHPLFKATGGAEYGIDDKAMEVILKVMCPEKTAVGALRIGDLLIAGVPGELACDMGLEVKNKLAESGIKYPVIGGLANEWISYILSAEHYKQGGYEPSVSFYGPDLGETIVQGMLKAAMSLLRDVN